MKNKNAAVSEWANTRKPAQVLAHLHNGRQAAPHGIVYDNPAFFVKGGFAVLVPCACVA